MIKIIKPKFIEQIKQHLMVLIGLFTPFGNKEKQAEPLQVSTVHFSIRTKILLALGLVIVTIGATNAIFVGKILDYSRKYDAIITNITTANSISGNIKRDIDTEMWQIVAGKNSFEQGKQYQIIEDVNQKILRMQANTDSHRARIKLEIIRRSIQTLKEHIDKMGERIKQKSTAAENEAALEKIRFITSVIEEVVHEYALFEVKRTEKQYQVMHEGFMQWESISLIVITIMIFFSIIVAWNVSESIYVPIKKLHDVTTTITKNDLQALVTSDNVDEITELGMSFNIMIGKIKELLDAKVKEQENLKKAELRALQAQINPHFLYNTLDTIIWMAESKKTEQVVELVSALSQFFRISLSKGKDWITIREEVERTRNYLIIQKMRYRDILDYRIEMDEEVGDYTILKLTLQPLVENAIYHGIKNKRQGGTVEIRVNKEGDDKILLEVKDDGIGFTPQKLADIQEELEDTSGEIRLESGFGIGNVNQRIKLYYGKQYGLSIRSEYQQGTVVSLVIPALNGAMEEKQAEIATV